MQTNNFVIHLTDLEGMKSPKLPFGYSCRMFKESKSEAIQKYWGNAFHINKKELSSIRQVCSSPMHLATHVAQMRNSTNDIHESSISIWNQSLMSMNRPIHRLYGMYSIGKHGVENDQLFIYLLHHVCQSELENGIEYLQITIPKGDRIERLIRIFQMKYSKAKMDQNQFKPNTHYHNNISSIYSYNNNKRYLPSIRSRSSSFSIHNQYTLPLSPNNTSSETQLLPTLSQFSSEEGLMDILDYKCNWIDPRDGELPSLQMDKEILENPSSDSSSLIKRLFIQAKL